MAMSYYRQQVDPTSRVDSHFLNDAMKGIATDITSLNTKIFELENELNAHIHVAGANDRAFQSQLEILETQLNNSVSNNTSFISSYDTEEHIMYPSTAIEENKASWEREYGSIYLPIEETTQEYMVVDDVTKEMRLIDNPEQYVEHYLTNNKFLTRLDRIEENNIANAIDGDRDTAFVSRAISYNDSINKIDNVNMIYTFDLVEQRDINLIKLIPAPELQQTIEELIVDSPGAGRTIPLDVNGTEYTFPITYAPRKAFFMRPIQASSIIMNMEQPTTVGGYPYEFITGIRHLSIEYNVYYNVGYIGFKFPVPSGKTGLLSVLPDWDADDQSRVNVYTDKDSFDNMYNTPINNGTNTAGINLAEPYIFPPGTTEIYVLFKLRPITGVQTTSVLRGCKVRWY